MTLIEREHLEQRVRYADAVALVWISGALDWGSVQMDGRTCAHPLSCVREALRGTTEAAQFGCTEQELGAALAVIGRGVEDEVAEYRAVLALV